MARAFGRHGVRRRSLMPGNAHPVDGDGGADVQGVAGMSVLITGGGSGLGAGVAQLLARKGARVTICDIAEADAAEDASVREKIAMVLLRYLSTDTLLCWAPEAAIVKLFAEAKRHQPSIV